MASLDIRQAQDKVEGRLPVRAACLLVFMIAMSSSFLLALAAETTYASHHPPRTQDPQIRRFEPLMSLGQSTTRAGMPADITMRIVFPAGNEDPAESISLNLPPGLAPDPYATASFCEDSELDKFDADMYDALQRGEIPGPNPDPSETSVLDFPCDEDVVGTVRVEANAHVSDTNTNAGAKAWGYIVNRSREPPHHGRLQLVLYRAWVSQVGNYYLAKAIDVSGNIDVREQGDLSVDSLFNDITWGYPINPLSLPDDYSLYKTTEMRISLKGTLGYRPNDPARSHALLRLPTECGDHYVTGTLTSWGNLDGSSRQVRSISAPVVVDGCRELGFAPTIDMDVEPLKAESPIGLKGEITVPNFALGQADIKSMELIFPRGMGINMERLTKIKACPEERARQGTCGGESRIGEIETRAPMLPPGEPLKGEVHLATLTGQGLAVAVSLKGFVSINMVGPLNIDMKEGTISTTFDSMPRFPIQAIAMRIYGGRDALLKAPKKCGKQYEFAARFQSWSGMKHRSASSFTLPCGEVEAESAPTVRVKSGRRALALAISPLGAKRLGKTNASLKPVLKAGLLKRKAFRKKLASSLARKLRRTAGDRSLKVALNKRGALTVSPSNTGARKMALKLKAGQLVPWTKRRRAKFKVATRYSGGKGIFKYRVQGSKVALIDR